jgi:hypothetical protein
LFSPVQQKAKEAPEKNRERTKRAFRHLDESLLNSYIPFCIQTATCVGGGLSASTYSIYASGASSCRLDITLNAKWNNQ